MSWSCSLSWWVPVLSAVMILPSPVRAAAVRLDLEAECKITYATLERDLAGQAWFARVADQSFRRDALILSGDHDPLDVLMRRTRALLNHLQRQNTSQDLALLAAGFEAFTNAVAGTAITNSMARRQLFAKAWNLQRRISFANPLLDFDKILFVGSYAARVDHCCDQYFGFNARPGGSVYVLEKAFSSEPEVRDLLATARVSAGRRQGKGLAGGSFRSPELSYDGKTVFFAYSECHALAADTFTPVAGCPSNHWNPGLSYHIFKLDLEEPGKLEQLTDGPWNEFDPCLLPNGRLAFISERRGGFGRCHPRPVPTYTLHSMRPDGSDIVCLSFHETNEWQPSVTHEGMIIYTRWDYVDRGDCTAHHPWLTYPDGRDPRAIQGNYPIKRRCRPDMEMDIRVIPGSSKFVATAAPHHGQAYGSLVVVDPRVPDDGAMAPVRRLTPEDGFPETGEKASQAYGTAWPLDEDFYLCVYSAPGSGLGYGLYLVDSFGNKTLIYRNKSMPCLAPIPLRPRPVPPIIPPATAVGLPVGEASNKTNVVSEAIIGCVNVYDSMKSWPTGTVISALRVIQLFPKATPMFEVPKMGVGCESLARGVVGTVPVEPDGSVRFIAPVGKPLYFQALDTNGCAIQSMMSETYAHPGESLTCRGCHENPHRSGRNVEQEPLAFLKPPRRLTPEADGSYPCNFNRLVQPVLERHCVACHQASKAAPALDRGKSYDSLTRGGGDEDLLRGYAFACAGRPVDRMPCETTPGQFGARASRLYALLQAGHHAVKLPPEDLRRITLWLDCNSVLYGAYHDLERQKSGECAMPTLE